jgi:hypothetical protein
MVVDDIQQKSQEEHKSGLDKILKSKDRLEDLKELVRILSQALAKYIFDGMVKGPRVSVNGETGEINMYLNGIAFSKEQILRSIGKDPYIGEVEKVVYKFGGRVSIKDDKLKLELDRGDAFERTTYGYGVVGVIEMKKEEYESKKMGLYHLRELAEKDGMLSLAIYYLERKLFKEGIGERKRIYMEYDMSTGDLIIQVCGDAIIENFDQFYVREKCIELQGKKRDDGIILNIHPIEYKSSRTEGESLFFKKEEMHLTLNRILSEETLKQRILKFLYFY